MICLNYGQSAKDYRQAEGLNKSSIDKILKCPAEYHELQLLPDVEPTPAMRFGTALHSYALTPERFSDDVCVLTASATSKIGKAAKKEAEEAGKVVISMDDHERICRMRGHMTRHPRIRPLLPHVECELSKGLSSFPGSSEISVYWERDVFCQPLQCKARIDRVCLLPDNSVIAVDLKTTSGGLDKDSIAKHIAQYGYYRQAAWYTEGLQANGYNVQAFVFIFTSTQPPYLCVPVTLDARAEMLGQEECKIAAEAYVQAITTDTWPTYSESVYELDIPEWAYYRSPAKLPTMYD